MTSQTWPSTLPSPSPAYGFDATGRAIYGAGNRVFNQSRTRDGDIVYLFNVNWEMLDAEFTIFRTFFQTTLVDGALPFDVDLALGDTSSDTVEVFFLSGAYSVRTGGGLRQDVSAQLVCHSPAFLTEASLDTLLALEGDLSFVDSIDDLNNLVEVTMPANL